MQAAPWEASGTMAQGAIGLGELTTATKLNMYVSKPPIKHYVYAFGLTMLSTLAREMSFFSEQ